MEQLSERLKLLVNCLENEKEKTDSVFLSFQLKRIIDFLIFLIGNTKIEQEQLKYIEKEIGTIYHWAADSWPWPPYEENKTVKELMEIVGLYEKIIKRK